MFIFKMNSFNCLIPIYNISNKFNIPYEILRYIYFTLINNSSNIIINKWYSYIEIHNTNLARIINKIPQKYYYNGFCTYYYYDLNDINLYITLKICLKYIKPGISDKYWWNNFLQYCFYGKSFCFPNNVDIVKKNIFLVNKLYKKINS